MKEGSGGEIWEGSKGKIMLIIGGRKKIYNRNWQEEKSEEKEKEMINRKKKRKIYERVK